MVPAPVPGQPRRQVLPVFLALPQRSPSAARAQTACCRLAPGWGRASPAHHYDVQVSSDAGSAFPPSQDTGGLWLCSGAGQLAKASTGPAASAAASLPGCSLQEPCRQRQCRNSLY